MSLREKIHYLLPRAEWCVVNPLPPRKYYDAAGLLEIPLPFRRNSMLGHVIKHGPRCSRKIPECALVQYRQTSARVMIDPGDHDRAYHFLHESSLLAIWETEDAPHDEFSMLGNWVAIELSEISPITTGGIAIGDAERAALKYTQEQGILRHCGPDVPADVAELIGNRAYFAPGFAQLICVIAGVEYVVITSDDVLLLTDKRLALADPDGPQAVVAEVLAERTAAMTMQKGNA